MISEKKASSVLVVAAHPDDEVLGCGGTMARFAELGVDVTILILGEGPVSRVDVSDTSLHQQQRAHAFDSALAAGAVLGVKRVITAGSGLFNGLPDNKFDSVPLIDIVKLIESVGEEVAPNIVITHHGGDLNVDHRITHQAVLTAFRPLPDQIVQQIWCFEVLSSTEYSSPLSFPPFCPSLYVDISTTLKKKITALKAYGSEMRPPPHPRSFRGVFHLARLRGHQGGLMAAESFALIRQIIK